MNWQEIYKHLKSKGFDVYSLGQHKGLCTSPYIVLRNNGSITQYGVADRRYEILMYVPFDKYSQMEEFTESVKDAMSELFPHVKLADDEQPHYPDDDVNGYMTSIIYSAPKVARYQVPKRIKLKG